MRDILKAYWDIALKRRDPSVLPDSRTALLAVAALYAATSAVQSLMLFGNDRLLLRTAADLVVSVAPVWLLLAFTGHRHRFNQTTSAVLGTGALLSPLVILLLALRPPAGSGSPAALLVWAASVAVILWYTFIVGHIVSAALDTGPITGVAVALAYVVASMQLLSWLFPGSA